MPYIPTGKILAKPAKPARLYYALYPFLRDRRLARPKARWWDEILAECEEKIWSSNEGDGDVYLNTKGIAPQVEIYNRYHELIIKQLHCLSDRIVIFQNGVVPDMSDVQPQFLGIDHASDRNRLSAEQIRLFYRHPEIDSTRFVFQPVAPLIVPYYVNKGRAAAVFINEIRAANRSVPGKWKMGIPVRRLRPYAKGKRGIYKFSPAMFDARLAKQFYPRENERKLDRYCQFCRDLVANAFVDYMERARIGQDVYVFSMRKSPSFKIIEKAAEISGRRLHDFSKIMRNKRYPIVGECEPSSLSILENAVVVLGGGEYARDSVRAVPA